MWLWNVMDAKTRYILASHLTPRRDANAARVVLRKAALAADKPPKTITSDKLRSYIQPVKDVLPDASHIQSEGIRASINNNLSERLQGTFRARIKTLRGLDSRKTGQRYLDGWVLTYNHFRGHESLGNKTPGQRAKANPPFREWADVVKAGAASRPASQSSRKLSPSPVVPSETRESGARKRRRIKPPKPVFPRMSKRTRNVPPHRFPSRFPNGFDITLHPERLHQPRHWKAPRLVFVNSMSDLFHKDIPDDFLVDVWATMLATPQHTYQILTKRPHRMAHKIRTLKLTIRFFVEPGQAVVALEHGYRESQVTVPQASITPTPPSLRCQPLNRDEGLHYVTLMDANDRRTTTAPFAFRVCQA